MGAAAAGALTVLAAMSTDVAEALYFVTLPAAAATPRSAAAAAPSNAAEALASRGLAPSISAVMQQVRQVQHNRQCSTTVFAGGSGATATPRLPVDTVIMDEAACCPDFAMPCVLATRPMNLVRLPL